MIAEPKRTFVHLFEGLVSSGELGMNYIFFGEGEGTKKIVANSLANLLEGRKFELPRGILQEVLLIHGDQENVGIDTAREIKRHLSQRPLFGQRRVVIVERAENLTLQAENALLKITEEPPADSLIILLVRNYEVLLPTLTSRFQKIHFPREQQLSESETEPEVHSLARKMIRASAEIRRKLLKEYLDSEADPLALVDALILEFFSLNRQASATVQRALSAKGRLASLNLNPRLQIESIF